MTDSGHRPPAPSLLLLLAGLLVGGLIAGASVIAVVDAVRGEAPTVAMPAPTFSEETGSDGIDQVYDGEFQYFVGGGAAVMDCNLDELPDLFLAGGTNEAGLYINRSDVGGPLRFTQIQADSTALEAVTGAYPIDIDSDGVTDLVVLRVGGNVILRGLGDCRFEAANDLWGIDGGNGWTVAFSASWEEEQVMPTLAFGNYLALDGLEDRRHCDNSLLIRPRGERYQYPTPLAPGWCTLSILFSDWSRQGDRDLRMTNDRHYYRDGQEQLWRIEPGESPELYTEADGWQTMQIWGMGIASHDVTGDGTPEVFLTSQGDNKMQTLAQGTDKPIYEDIALSLGATAHRPFIGDINRPSTAWHAEFGDVNNDAFIDLLVTKGNVEAMPEFATDDPNNLLLGQPDGTFVEGASAADILDYGRSRGGALADLNLDGLLDLVVVDRREEVRVWRNTGAGGNWLAVDIRQAPPNSDAIGAWVEARIGSTVMRTEVTIGGGHAGGELGPLHFGLGRAESADIRVIWPDGEQGDWTSVDVNRRVVVDRQSGNTSTPDPIQDGG